MESWHSKERNSKIYVVWEALSERDRKRVDEWGWCAGGGEEMFYSLYLKAFFLLAAELLTFFPFQTINQLYFPASPRPPQALCV